MEVYYYCLESSTLTKRRIKEVYAEGDLFKDPSNPLDVGQAIEIERELSKIESSASITVKFIHQAIENREMMNNGDEGSTTRPANLYIKRKHLELLHKFMFIMHYHQPSVSTTYFDLDNPSNSMNFQWIKAYQTRYDLLKGPKHIWLHLLRHYLITPHLELYESGRRIYEKIYNESPPTGTLPDGDRSYSTTKIDPKLDDWKCFGYYLRTQRFLAIWEAAREEEFVMSSNSFGVYEGETILSGELHRFFVVSPRIVLVLYHPGLTAQEYANGSTDLWKLAPEDTDTSLLVTAPRKRADVKYVSDQPPPSHSLFSANPEVFAASPGDDFTFEICPLSPEDTHTVNGIILERLLETGAVTFGSRDAALRTLTQYNMNPEFDADHKHKVQSLIQHLSPLGSVQTIRQRYFASRVPSKGLVWANDLELYRLLQEGTDADCIRFRKWEEYYRSLWLADETPHVPYRPARLVSTMDDILARDTFIALSQLMTTFGIDPREERIFDEQLLIGLLGYLVKHNRCLVELIEEDLLGPTEGRGGRGIMEYIDVGHSLSGSLGTTANVHPGSVRDRERGYRPNSNSRHQPGNAARAPTHQHLLLAFLHPPPLFISDP